MKYKKLMIIILPLLVVLLSVGGTLAYYKINIPSNTEIQVSRFDTTIETVYESPDNWSLGSTDTYNFAVKNVSSSPFMVRVKVDDVWTDGSGNEYTNVVNGEKIAKLNFVNASDWKKIGNYYYYKYEVEENEITSNLISGITFNSNYNGTTICTYDTTNNTESCINSPNDYTSLTYKAVFTTDIITSSSYESVWNVLSSDISQNSTYSVNFIPNMTGVTGAMTSEDFVYGTSKALTANSYAKTGYIFNSWNTKYNGTGTSYNNEEVVLDIANGDTDILNLYAIWNNLYSVSFVSSDTTNCPLNATTYSSISNIAYGSLIKENALANPECAGYTFTGWTASGDIDTTTAKYGSINTPNTSWVNGNTGTYFKDLSTTANGTVTLTAGWTPAIYTLTLNNQSATTVGTTEVFEKYATGWYSDSTATTSTTTITKPVKTGLYFDGYYTGQNGAGTKVIDSTGTILSTNTTFTSNTTLYANWVEVWAENLSFNPSTTGFDCDEAQCALDELHGLLN